MKTKFEKKYYDNNLFSEEDEHGIIRTIQEFCRDNDKYLTNTMAKHKKTGVIDEKIRKNVSRGLNKIFLPKPRTTYPDELTSILLENIYKHPRKERDEIINHYANQKQAEMYIGELLELYIQKFGLKFGWCYSGTTIRDTDFIKKVGNEWSIYQIKNSDNTENSASAQVRENTKIYKWSRRVSKKKDTFYWDTFPDDRLKSLLSEVGFRQFIIEYYKNITEY